MTSWREYIFCHIYEKKSSLFAINLKLLEKKSKMWKVYTRWVAEKLTWTLCSSEFKIKYICKSMSTQYTSSLQAEPPIYFLSSYIYLAYQLVDKSYHPFRMTKKKSYSADTIMLFAKYLDNIE